MLTIEFLHQLQIKQLDNRHLCVRIMIIGDDRHFQSLSMAAVFVAMNGPPYLDTWDKQ